MTRCPAHGNRIQMNPSRAVNLFGATPQPDCRRTHDYVYSINYVDSTGNIQATAIAFKNNTPANQFMMEMMGMTGLAVGQVNTTLQARIEQIRAESAEKSRVASLDYARPLKPYSCSWQSYLEANSSVKTWAERNPALVPAEKTRLGAVD